MFCKNCGNKIIEGSKFCGGCGSSSDHIKTIKETQLQEDPELSLLKREVRKIAIGLILKGLGIIVVGGVISWIAYSMATPGGTYLVFVGVFIVGIWSFLKGLFYFIFPSLFIKNETGK